MATKSFNLIFFTIIFALLAFLIYSLNTRPKVVTVYNENVPNTVHSEWWGYAWRPYWRKFDGIPGVNQPAVKPDGGEPLPAPKMHVPPKPIIINRA